VVNTILPSGDQSGACGGEHPPTHGTDLTFTMPAPSEFITAMPAVLLSSLFVGFCFDVGSVCNILTRAQSRR